MENSRTEQALMEREEKFSKVFNSNFIGHSIVNMQGVIVDINDAMASLVESTKEDIIGKTIEASKVFMLNEAYHEQKTGLLHKMKAAGYLLNEQASITLKSGKEIIVFISIEPIEISDVQHILISTINSTDKNNVGTDLKNSELLFWSLTSHVPVAIFQTDITGACTYVNEEWLKHSGMEFEEAMGFGFAAAIHPDDKERILKEWSHAVATKTEFKSELRFVDKNGRIRWLATKTVNVMDSENNLTSYIGMNSDITEIKEAQIKIKNSEEKYRILSEISPDYIMRYDKEGRHTYMNKAALEISGYTVDQVIGKTHREAGFDAQQSDYWEQRIEYVFRTGETVQEQFEYEGTSGTIHLDWRLSPEVDSNGKVISVLGVSRDITKLHNAESEIRESEKFLKIITDNIPNSYISVINKDMTIGYTGGEAFTKLNLNPEAFHGKAIVEVFSQYGKELTDKIVEAYRKTFAGESQTFELFIQNQYQLYKTVPLITNDNEINTILVVVENISEIKLNEIKIKENEEKYRSLIEQASDGIAIIDQTGNFLEVNESYCSLLGYSMEEFMSLKLNDVIPEEDIVKKPFQLAALIAGENLIYERRMKRKDGSIFMAEINSKMAANGTLIGFLRDISDRKKTERILEGEKAILEMMAKDQPLDIILSEVALNYEAVSENAICSILLLSKDEKRLMHSAAPSLPVAFNDAINNEPIGPQAGSCGTAVYRKESVIVGDIATDPLWINYKELALSYGLKACWSTPIFNNKKEVLGCFAIYYKESRLPSPEELRMIERTTSQVKIILEKYYQELQIKESEEKFRTLVQQSADGIFLVDKVGNYLDANESSSQMTGYSIDELKNMHALDLIEAEDLKLKPYMIAEMIKGQKLFLERVLKRKDGTFIEVEIASNLMDNEKIITTIRDITERKKSQKKLAESENRLRTILENEPECVKLLDKFGKIVDMNPAGLNMIEADNLEMIKGEKVLQIINEPFRAAFANLTKKVFEGESGKIEFEITGLKGTKRQLETNAVPFRDQSGDIIYLLGVTRDVTERKNAENKISQLNRELEQRVKERTAELETTNSELKEVNDLFVGREARIIELKEELGALKNSFNVK